MLEVIKCEHCNLDMDRNDEKQYFRCPVCGKKVPYEQASNPS